MTTLRKIDRIFLPSIFILFLTVLSFSVSSQTDYSPLFTSANFVKTIDLAKPVGTVEGIATTTPTGAATYTIPIYTPPGTNGMAPSIDIVYNSQKGPGIAGYGWSISGMSVISRTGKNMYHNGRVSPVTFTSEDAFILDGVRLNPVNGSNGANLTVYREEAESFSLITSYTTGSANNPDKFIVIQKDGTIREYGNTTDSRILSDNGSSTIFWCLNRVIDINGNYTEYIYKSDMRDLRLDEIRYSGNINTGLAPFNTIRFDYGYRHEVNTVYDAGASVTSYHLLTHIVITHKNDLGVDETVKSYNLKYGYDNINSYLKEIEECGVSGPCLNSTIFLYGEKGPELSGFEYGHTYPDYDHFSGDYDGDGKSDVLAAKYYYDGNNCKRYTEYTIYKDFEPNSATHMYTYTMPEASIIGSGQNVQFSFLASDFSKDGKDDVLFLAGSIVEAGQTFWMTNTILNTTGEFNGQTGFWNYTTQMFGYPISNGQHYTAAKVSDNIFVPGDFDGDGNQDYILILETRPSCTYKAFLSMPALNEFNLEIADFGVGPNSYPGSYARTIAEAKKVIPVDFDGDGKMELLVTRDNVTYIVNLERIAPSSGINFVASIKHTSIVITNNDNVFPADFNADRKTDFLIRHKEPGFEQWYISYSNGLVLNSIPFSFVQTVWTSGYEIVDKILIGDYNGDGKSDIAHGYDVGTNHSKISVYYSKGVSSAIPFFYEQYDNTLCTFPPIVLTSDFNGDGRHDLIARWPNSLYFINIRPNGQEKLLKKITDGHNVTTSFEYKNMTDKSTFPYTYNRTISLNNPQNQSPLNYIQHPIPLVSSLTIPDGIGGLNITTYRYEDAILHRYAKGFLGFRKNISINAVTGITLTSEHDINTQFAVLYPVRETKKLTSTGELIGESLTTNSFSNLSTGIHDIRFFKKVDKFQTFDFLNGSGTEVVNTYDNYGNITDAVTKVGYWSGSLLVTDETNITNTSFGIHNTPFPAKPDNITETNTRTGMPAQSSTTNFAYLGNGLLSTKTIFYGQPLSVTTTLAYNSFGNLTQMLTSASGVSNRVVNATYDARGRFEVMRESVDGSNLQTETWTYDGKWGQPLTYVSIGCLTTSFAYDPYGRLISTTVPEGYSILKSLNWDVQPLHRFFELTDFPGGQPDVKSWVDISHRKIKTQTVGFNNQWLTQITNYNARGLEISKTNSYYASETPFVTTNTYDVYGRVEQVSNPISTVTYTYTKLPNGKLLLLSQNNSGQSSSKTTDATGKVISSIDDGGELVFTYDSHGNQAEVKHGTTIIVSTTYDQYNRRISLMDKNAGTTTYTYDAYGQLIQQTDAANHTYTMTYDGFGRILSRENIMADELTTYEYYTNNGVTRCPGHKLKKVVFNTKVWEYSYDSYKRLQSEGVTIDGMTFNTYYTYDTYGNLTNTTYPSGVVVNNTYDVNGKLISISGGDSWNPVTLFTANDENGYGQSTSYTLGNGLTSQNSYQYGIPTRFYTPGIQDLNFNFDLARGNLLSRYDAIKNLNENFQYDNLDRLATATVNGITQTNISFDGTSSFSLGNIVSKSDAGNYVYKNDKIHAVAYITNPAGPTAPPISIPTSLQSINYTPFLKVASIGESSIQTLFTYGHEYQRVKTEFSYPGYNNTIKYFIGTYEKVINGGGSMDIHYVSTGNGSCIVIQKSPGANSSFHFMYTDFLGSLLARTDIYGTVTAEQNFDAWGRERNPNTWQFTTSGVTNQFFDRGYTGHEHLPHFGLINMNGRLYDPIQARMLSPDNYVPDPWHSQGYNRYSYALNNPLKYTDPEGDNPVAAAIVGAVFGAYTAGVFANNGQMNPFQWRNFSESLPYIIGGAVIGGFSGFIGGTVSASGIPFSQTAGIVYSSFFNSAGMSILTNGAIPVSAGFGFGSYNIHEGEFSYFGSKGNSFGENLGYFFGALANYQDLMAGFDGTSVKLNAHVAKDDLTGHSTIYNDAEGIDISVASDQSVYGAQGPKTNEGTLGREFEYIKKAGKKPHLGRHYTGYPREGWTMNINNVNRKRLVEMTNNLDQNLDLDGKGPLMYGGGIKYGCMGLTTRALARVGIPTLPVSFHPLVLNLQMAIRQAGIYSIANLIIIR